MLRQKSDLLTILKFGCKDILFHQPSQYMNFLAHIFLSCDNEDLLIGNFIADFIRNKEVANYSSTIQQGIHLHRQIDTYTDNHPIVRKGVHRLHPNHKKYAPVVIDILFDHLLARNWSRYSGESLKNFTNGVYEILNKRMDELPEKLKKRLPAMIEADWLTGYGTKRGMEITFRNMDKRTKFPSNFIKALDDLENDYDAYNTEFNQFFPDVITYVENNCNC